MNNDHMTIGGRKYSAQDLELLTGEDQVKEPKGYVLLMARVLADPLKLPRMLKEICSICLEDNELKEFRLALIRVQVDAELRMHEDIQRYQQRRYVAQVIEILMFNELLLAPREQVEEVELE